jgi:RNA polymerase sigma-70 factor (ECF subfamily)
MDVPAAGCAVALVDVVAALPATGKDELRGPTPIYDHRKMRKGPAIDPPFAAELLRHLDALYNFARYLTRDGSLAEDLVQDTFARALAARDRFIDGTNPKAWLFRILRNAFIDGRRKHGNSPTRGGIDATDASDDDVRDADRLRGDVEMERLRGLVAQDIEAALLSLSAEARMVVLMDLEGFTEAEMAAVMESPVGTVKSRLSRARGVLRERLKDYAR